MNTKVIETFLSEQYSIAHLYSQYIGNQYWL